MKPIPQFQIQNPIYITVWVQDVLEVTFEKKDFRNWRQVIDRQARRIDQKFSFVMSDIFRGSRMTAGDPMYFFSNVNDMNFHHIATFPDVPFWNNATDNYFEDKLIEYARGYERVTLKIKMSRWFGTSFKGDYYEAMFFIKQQHQSTADWVQESMNSWDFFGSKPSLKQVSIDKCELIRRDKNEPELPKPKLLKEAPVDDPSVYGGNFTKIEQGYKFHFAAILKSADIIEVEMDLPGNSAFEAAKAAQAEFYAFAHGGRYPNGSITAAIDIVKVINRDPQCWIAFSRAYNDQEFGSIYDSDISRPVNWMHSALWEHRVGSLYQDDHSRLTRNVTPWWIGVKKITHQNCDPVVFCDFSNDKNSGIWRFKLQIARVKAQLRTFDWVSSTNSYRDVIAPSENMVNFLTEKRIESLSDTHIVVRCVDAKLVASF